MVKKLSMLVLHEHISPADLISKKAQKWILGGSGGSEGSGTKKYKVCCKPGNNTCSSEFDSDVCEGDLCGNQAPYNCW